MEPLKYETYNDAIEVLKRASLKARATEGKDTYFSDSLDMMAKYLQAARDEAKPQEEQNTSN